jgi:hypothetical protein
MTPKFSSLPYVLQHSIILPVFKNRVLLQAFKKLESQKFSSFLITLSRCPYLPDEDTEDDGGSNDDSSARLLVLTKNSVADVFNVDTVRLSSKYFARYNFVMKATMVLHNSYNIFG